MKYRGMKEVYICLGVIFSFLTVYGAVAAFTRWNDCDAGVNALMLVMLCISVIGAVYFLSCLRQPPVRTEFRADGIHVLSTSREPATPGSRVRRRQGTPPYGFRSIKVHGSAHRCANRRDCAA